jgi:hypothetical protein
MRHEPLHVVLLRAKCDGDALVIEPLDQAGITRRGRVSLETAAVAEGAVDFGALNQNVAHAILIDLI